MKDKLCLDIIAMLLKSHFSYLMVNFLKMSDVIQNHDYIPSTGKGRAKWPKGPPK